jgi:hypothetical protein
LLIIEVFHEDSPNPTPERERGAQRIAPTLTLLNNAELIDSPQWYSTVSTVKLPPLPAAALCSLGLPCCQGQRVSRLEICDHFQNSSTRLTSGIAYQRIVFDSTQNYISLHAVFTIIVVDAIGVLPPAKSRHWATLRPPTPYIGETELGIDLFPHWGDYYSHLRCMQPYRRRRDPCRGYFAVTHALESVPNRSAGISHIQRVERSEADADRGLK